MSNKQDIPQEVFEREMTDVERFQWEELKDLEKTMSGAELLGATRYTDSQFRRVGLPILSGLLDDTFNPLLWAEYIGSNYVPLEILTDDLREVIFTLPPLLMTGPAIVQNGETMSLSAQSIEIAQQGAIIAENGSMLINQLINNVGGVIDKKMYGMNFERARMTIKTINEMFEHYGLEGRIDYPQGLTPPTESQGGQPVKQKEERVRYDLNDGDDL